MRWHDLPEDRYATVEEFRADLVDALRGRASRRRRWAAFAGGGLLASLIAAVLLFDGPQNTQESNTTLSTGPIEAWIVHDRTEQLQWFEQNDPGEGQGPLWQPLMVQGRKPSTPGLPALPSWPATRPVMVVSSANTLGFIHPLNDPALGRRVLRDWHQLLTAPAPEPESNFCNAGSFNGECMVYDDQTEGQSWRIIDPTVRKNGDNLSVIAPPDNPGNPALLLHKQDAQSLILEFGCYQWLSRIPDRAGTVMVMRYRARAEEGEGRLTIRAQLPLLLPINAPDETSRRLRSLSTPHAELEHGPTQEPRQYRLENWVTPGREWQTYYTIWEWPPHCQAPGFAISSFCTRE